MTSIPFKCQQQYGHPCSSIILTTLDPGLEKLAERLAGLTRVSVFVLKGRTYLKKLWFSHADKRGSGTECQLAKHASSVCAVCARVHKKNRKR